jgi:hypothetical protein
VVSLVVRSGDPFRMQYPQNTAVHAFPVTAVNARGRADIPDVDSALIGYLADDPGVLEGELVPALVASAYAAMARNHFGFEQDPSF